jgi:membrane peptidoglycan carboxypeptidase
MSRRPLPPRERGAGYRGAGYNGGFRRDPRDAGTAQPGYRRPLAGRPRPGAALPAIILGSFALLAAAMFVGAMAVYAAYTGGLPGIDQVENFQLNEGSSIVSADGVELATFAAEQRRSIPYNQIPKVMVDAQVAAEDQTFWTNPCVDFRGILRALLQNLSAGREVSGASTICQQLIRMRLFSPELLADPHRQLERKLKEAVLALRLGERYPGDDGKRKLLEMYVNQVYYGNKAYGIWSAANTYFGKDITKTDKQNQLTAGEAALLAGLVRAPSALDPTKAAVQEKDAKGKTILVVPPDADAIRVQGFVLDEMLQQGYLTADQLDAAKAEKIVLSPTTTQRYRAPHFVYAVRAAANDLLGGEELLDSGGLTVTTTLNYNGYQKYAEKWAAVAYDMNHMTAAQLTGKYGRNAQTWIQQLQKRNINNDALVTLNYRTGAVLAYVGSANYYGKASKAFQPNYDVVGTAYRQAGSAFKPITYSTGFELNAVTPATMLMDVKGDMVNGYSVPDADGRERGPVRIRDALKYSLNIPAVKSQQVIGTDNVLAQAERYGLRFDPRQAKEAAVPSLTLGTIGVHLIDLAGAYGAIAGGGIRAEPYLIEKITDRSGKVIYDHASDGQKPERVISAQSAYLVTDILADNTDPAQNRWWGGRFQLPGGNGGRRPATLKTGTTNDFRDLQAFGYLAPDKDANKPDGAIVTGVWVGNSDFSPIRDVFAADGPTFIWHDYMAEVAAHNKLAVRDFPRPDGIVEKQVDAMSGMLPGPHTTHVVTELFKADNVPNKEDTVHATLTIEAATGKIWQTGCGDQLGGSPAPSGSAQPSASPTTQPGGRVWLDLGTWEQSHKTWMTADQAWITKWRGRERSIPRFPLQALDAPLAPAEKCTPGAVPTSTPTPSPSPTPSATPVPTATPEPTPTPKPNQTGSPSPTPAATSQPTPAALATPTEPG